MEEKSEIVLSDSSLIENLITHCSSSSFKNTIEAFKQDHAYAFARLAEEKTTDGEHPLALTDIFNNYQSIIEDQFRTFAEKKNVSVEHIFEVIFVIFSPLS